MLGIVLYLDFVTSAAFRFSSASASAST